MPTLKELSNTNWNSGNQSLDSINAGSLQRIADATEAMASEYNRLIRDLKWYKELAERRYSENERMANRIRSLKGVITKLKKKSQDHGK